MAKYSMELYQAYKKKIKSMGGKEFFSPRQFFNRPKLVRGWKKVVAGKKTMGRTGQVQRGLSDAGINKRQKVLRD